MRLDTRKTSPGRASLKPAGLVRVRKLGGTVTRSVERADLEALLASGEYELLR